MKATLKRDLELRGFSKDRTWEQRSLAAGTDVLVVSTKKSMGRALIKLDDITFSCDLADLQIGEVVQ